MFDLEQSIADWRKQMLAAGIKTPVPLEELEIHLREEIELQMKAGTNPPQAFENSVQRMGHADELKVEFKKICGMACVLPQWSLFWTGVLGLVMTPMLSLGTSFIWHTSGLDSLSHPSRAVWLPNYVTFTTFTISGLVIGFARWHTKWTLLWISSLGLIGTIMVKLVRLFVFHRSDTGFFLSDRLDLSWWAFYANWMIFIITGLLLGRSNWTLWSPWWLKKLIKTARD